VKTMELNSTQTPPPGCRVFIGPDKEEQFSEAVLKSGCEIVNHMSEAEALIWFGRDPAALVDAITSNIRWLQIPDAGAEKWLHSPIVSNRDLVVTCASGIYGHQVAEHALALILACYRGLATYSRAISWNPRAASVRSLVGAKVVILGAGGIGGSLVEMLVPLKCVVTVVTRSGRHIPSASRSVLFSQFEEEIRDADVLVLAAPETKETRHIINSRTLGMMKPSAVIVNVARGTLIDNEALLEAVNDERILGAGLDVTDPEPLPDGHPFIGHPRILLTPHVANPPAMKKTAFAKRIEENCRRFKSGKELLGVIDFERGY
jgi:phosphoglycerate dehydrogenase-like enzyme